MAHTITLRGAGESRLLLAITGYGGADLGDYHDANRLRCRLTLALHSGGARSLLETELAVFTWELAAFAKALQPAYAQNAGSAEFRTLEGQAQFIVAFDTSGDVKVRGAVECGGARENRLQFQLTSDATRFEAVLRELNAAIAAYPVRGF